MTSKDYETVKTLKERLSQIVQVLDFKVFGSRARGDYDEHSDIDVFIKVPKLDKGLKEKILDITWEVGFENGVVMVPIICTKEELENTPLRASPFIKNILEEGISI